MKKLFCTVISSFVVIVFAVVLSGCSGNTNKNNSNEQPKTSVTDKVSDNDDANRVLSDDIQDYTVVTDKNTPLKVNELSSKDYSDLLDHIKSYGSLSSDVFKISYLKSWCSSIEFRQFNVDSSDSEKTEPYYYCIFSDADNGDVAYLIFGEIVTGESDKTYSCASYVTANKNEISEYPDSSFDWYSYICDSDLSS